MVGTVLGVCVGVTWGAYTGSLACPSAPRLTCGFGPPNPYTEPVYNLCTNPEPVHGMNPYTGAYTGSPKVLMVCDFRKQALVGVSKITPIARLGCGATAREQGVLQ